jgi:hypothetical protein
MSLFKREYLSPQEFEEMKKVIQEIAFDIIIDSLPGRLAETLGKNDLKAIINDIDADITINWSIKIGSSVLKRELKKIRKR